MKLQQTIISSAALVGSVLAVAACGGGGGSSASSSGTPTTASSVTSSNMQDVAAQGYGATAGFNATSGGSASSLVTGVAVNAAPPAVLDAVLGGLYLAYPAQQGNLVVGVATSQTVACTHGGSMLVTYNFASSTPSAGDSLSIDATSCVESNATVSGKLTFAFNSINGIPGQSTNWSGNFGLTFTNFSITENSDTVVANGSMTIGIAQTAPSTATVSVSGSSLNLAEQLHTGSSNSYTVTNFNASASLTSTSASTGVSYSLTGTTAKLGSINYAVKTLSDFKQTLSGLYPYQGALKLTATDNSSVTLTALDSTNVTLGLDKNGDGVIDETVTTTWAALEARL